MHANKHSAYFAGKKRFISTIALLALLLSSSSSVMATTPVAANSPFDMTSAEANLARMGLPQPLIDLLITAKNLRDQKKYEESINIYEQIVQQFSDSDDKAIQFGVLGALFSKSDMLLVQQQYEDVIVTSNKIIQQFVHADDEISLILLASTWQNKALALSMLEREDEAVAAYDEFIFRFNDTENESIRLKIDSAYSLILASYANKGTSLLDEGKNEEAFAAFKGATDRFGDSEDGDILYSLAPAWLYQAKILRGQNKNDEAIAIYDTFISRYDLPGISSIIQNFVVKAKQARLRLIDPSMVSGEEVNNPLSPF